MQVKGHLNQEWGINHLMKLVFVLSTAAITKVDDFCKLKAPFQQVFCHFGLKMLNSMVVMLYVIRNKKKDISLSYSSLSGQWKTATVRCTVICCLVQWAPWASFW